MRTVAMGACAFVVLLGLSTERADAGWRLDLQAGAFVPTSNVEFQRHGVEVDSGLGAGMSFVVGGGYGLGDWVELTAQLQAAGTADIYGDDNAGVVSFTPGARVFLLPTGHRFRPWLGGQLGWYRVNGTFNEDFIFNNRDDDVSRTDDSFGINVGGGFDVALNRRVSLGLDVRYHNAFYALRGFEFVTTNFNVGIHFGA
jgi:opacity protein-like surface antigen